MIVIWSLALLGILFKLTIAHRFKVLSLVTYLTMGWLSLIVVYQLAVKLSIGGVTLLAVGGLSIRWGLFSTSASGYRTTTLFGTRLCWAAAPAISWQFICMSGRLRSFPLFRATLYG
ncbi:hemolysin [Kluyvera cryocrescens]|uniref:Hemolysin n=1 Tax=Kluyvera cryocrescens TaxID=580 RepID=A0A485ASM7_KLUCR|nr:hemolysin [Kluyvera cryocrescens]